MIFGGGHNPIIPAKDYFAMMANIREFGDYIVYIRALGMKHMLRWNVTDSEEAALLSIAELFHLDHEVQHRLDICLALTASESAIFMSRAKQFSWATTQECRPRFFHPLLFATVGNMQGSNSQADDAAVIHSINFYTDMLSNIRVAGQLPTAACMPVLNHVTGLGIATNTTTQQQILANNAQVGALLVLIDQLRQRGWSARLEVTTMIQHLISAQRLLIDFAFRDRSRTELKHETFITLPVSAVVSYMENVLNFSMRQLRLLARDLVTLGQLPAKSILQFAKLEDLLFHSFMYGKLDSKGIKSRAATSRAIGSDIVSMDMQPADDGEPPGNDNYIQYISEKDDKCDYYLVVLSRQVQIDFEDERELQKRAIKMTWSVILALNSELEMQQLNHKYMKLDVNIKYLSGLIKVSRAPEPVTLDDASAIVAKLHFVFFVEHEVQYAKYWTLHRRITKLYDVGGCTGTVINVGLSA